MLFTWFGLFLQRLVQRTRAAPLMLVWLACLAVPAVLATTVSGTAGAQSKPVILVFGDSLSAEYGLARSSGWVALLEKRLTQERLNYSVANASISGETTSGGAARIEDALKQNRPALVILELGGNDGLRGLSVDATRANLEKMIKAAQKAGARVVLAGMQLPPNYGRAYTDKFRALYGELAKQHKVALVPFFLEGVAERRELFQADGIHPTAEAQDRLLANVWKALGPMLGKAPEKTVK
jgi:acyl-CoA thioesterase-1